jgi:hypothetical protein
MAKGFLSGFKGIDAFGKVRPDYIEVGTGKTDHVCHRAPLDHGGCQS